MIRVLHGDAREMLATLPDASVQCCLTSPPYFGLRDYGTAQWDGGDPACDHSRQSAISRASSTLGGATTTQGGAAAWRGACRKCGARRIDQQIGLEQTPQAYVAALVEVFREMRRVLKPEGLVFLNLGDSYAANSMRVPDGLKPKDLIGIPWRVAFALQDDGWWLRQDNIWAKSNPMPESVTDRTTRAHEYVFMLSKAASYFYDADAVKEPPTWSPATGTKGNANRERNVGGRSDGYTRITQAGGVGCPIGGRNKRSVWTINSGGGWSGAHFATMPEELATICILAGSRPGDTILDPFGGSGTTGTVACRLGRRATLIDLNPAYCRMAERRIGAETPPIPGLERVA